ncbi:SAGA complex subunit spt3 [Penicillium odoratum]|uniref:SAGA complex subunit spt3 n=1 Tax=Penicillium odoratum TaxID=1167516 RepID=UPI0025499753|nr:SAGA complex subunit spt3 [Penicillium odoratum]KAJ5753087.1 SAGA complex subunit spt3 [Penicillium odoratum]
MEASQSDPRLVQISPEDIEAASSDLFTEDSSSFLQGGYLRGFQQRSEHYDYDADLESAAEIEPRARRKRTRAPALVCHDSPSEDNNSVTTPSSSGLSFCLGDLNIIADDPSDADDQAIDSTSESDHPHSTEEDNQEIDATVTIEPSFSESIIDFFCKMMFVSGETAEPSIDTTTLIEDITRQQVLEILGRSTQLATRRGSRSISTDDLIFLIRHDKAKVSRLRTFLSWKDVRKNVKDSDDKGGADAADFAAADDAAGVVAGPQDVAAKPKNKRAKVGLAWDVHSYFSVQIPERDDEEDEEEEEQNYATLQRLAAADERTKHMTREEYVFWSECRQASFTYRKSKRFREWAGFGIVTESKPNDDIVDILGFLTFEIVQTLTEEALKVKEREDHEKNRGGSETTGENAKKRKRETSLFDPPEEGHTPIEPRHIREAYRKLQATPQKAVAMLLHNGRVPARLPLRLI